MVVRDETRGFQYEVENGRVINSVDYESIPVGSLYPVNRQDT